MDIRVTTERTTIHVTPGSDLERLIDAASATPVIREKDGVQYRVSREPHDVWVSYDSKAVRATIRSAAGMLSADEGEGARRERPSHRLSLPASGRKAPL